MIYPLLPLFLVQTLGAGPAFLGLVEGIAEASSSLLKLASGWIADRTGRRKPLVALGYGVATVGRPLIALASAPWQVLAVRFADRVGKGMRSAPRDALLAESVPAERRGEAFGLHRAADHAGAVIGPLLASGLLLAYPGQFRLVFALAAIPGLLAVLLVVAKVREASPVGVRSTRLSFETGSFSPVFRRYLAVVGLFTLGNASDAFLLLHARHLGVAVAMLPLLWAALHLSKMAWSVPGGRLADRLGPRRAISAGWLLYAAVYVGFAHAGTPGQAWGLFLVYGLFFGLTEAPEKALVARLAPAGLGGRAFGAYHCVVGLAALPASVLFGSLWQQFGPPTAFLAGAAFAVGAAVLLPFVSREVVSSSSVRQL